MMYKITIIPEAEAGPWADMPVYIGADPERLAKCPTITIEVNVRLKEWFDDDESHWMINGYRGIYIVPNYNASNQTFLSSWDISTAIETSRRLFLQRLYREIIPSLSVKRTVTRYEFFDVWVNCAGHDSVPPEVLTDTEVR